jgi:hypothetical protein
MDIKVLIAKIEKLQENIESQSKISPLDIDLQLSYIRALYDAYLDVKCDFTAPCCIAEESSVAENASSLSDCGTLPLFNSEEVTEVTEVTEVAEVTKVAEVQEVTEIANPPQEEVLPLVEMEVDMDFSIPDIAQEQEEQEEEEVSDINLDDIEFDEDGGEEDEAEVKTAPTSFPIDMPHSRYYGDEIEIENPIPVKPSATVGEQFKSEKPSLNEIVSSYKPDESIASKLQQGNVSDLMKSMDMNQKFMFVKDLFKGNGSAFTEEINKLNGFNKLNEAIPYMESLKTRYKWDSQSEAYSELYRLVLRKFVK